MESFIIEEDEDWRSYHRRYSTTIGCTVFTVIKWHPSAERRVDYVKNGYEVVNQHDLVFYSNLAFLGDKYVIIKTDLHLREAVQLKLALAMMADKC